MKKSIKFFAIVAFCFSVLANYLPVQAVTAPASITCPSCGKTANYNGSEAKSGWNISTHIVEETGQTCYVSDVGYEDMYRCINCGVITRRTHNEYGVHSIAHK